MRMRVALVACLLVVVGCVDDPATVDLAGVWVGTYTHPTTPGTLQFSLTSADAAVSGTFIVEYTPPGGGTLSFNGPVTGTRLSPTTVSLTIDHPSFTWRFAGLLTNANLIQGTWESLTNAGIDGQFSIERE